MKRTERASQQATRELDRMTAGIQRQIDTFGMTGAEVQKYEMRIRGASAAQLEMVDRLERMRSAQAAFNASANTNVLGNATASVNRFGVSLGQTQNAMRMLPAQFTDVATQLAGGQNPFLVLLQQGGQVKDSFGGIRPALAALGSYITPVAVGVATLAATVGTLGLAFYQGHQESVAFAKAITLTGNYAGITESQFRTMAHAVATSSGATIGASRDIVQGLIATGSVGPNAIQPMADAIARLQKNTGEDTDKIIGDFAKMGEGVTKWAEDHNKSWHFITLAQYEYIRSLEEAGKVEEAQLVVSQALSDHLGNALPANLGFLETALKSVANGWRAFWDAAKDIGRQQTIEQKLADVEAQLKRPPGSGSVAAIDSAFPVLDQGTDRSELETQRLILLRQQGEQVGAAIWKSNDARVQQAAINASKELKTLDDKTKGIDRQTDALKRLEVQENAIRAAGGIVTDEEHNRRVAEIKRQNAPPKGGAGRSPQDLLDDAVEKRLDSLGAESARLDNDIANWEQYGKAVNKSRVAVLEFDVAQGKLTGKGGAALTDLQLYTLWSAAYTADLKEEELALIKAGAAADKRTAAIEAAANAQAMNARQTKIANELQEIENSGLAKGTALYEQKAAARRDAVNAEFDAKLRMELAEQRRANDAEIRRLDEEAGTPGMSTLDRQTRAAMRSLRAQADKDIAANPGMTAQILDELIIKQDERTAAIKRTYEAQRTADAGVAEALRKYQEEATNFAKSADALTTKVLSGLEDGLTALMTGQKFNWHSLIDSIIAEVTRLYVIRPLLAALFGSGSDGAGLLGGIFGGGGLAGAPGGGGGGGGLLGSLFGSGGPAGFFGGIGKQLFGGGGMNYAQYGYGQDWSAGSMNGVLGDSGMDLFPSFAVGTNRVPYDGLAYLHKNEAVVPAAYNPAAGGMRGGGGGEGLVVTNNFVLQTPADRRTQEQIATLAGRSLRRVMSRGND